MIPMETIRDRLGSLYRRIDTTKCYANIQEIRDGFSLETIAIAKRVCSFRIEVTPFIFDVSALGCFNESDVEHDRYDFYELVLSMIQGHAHVERSKSGLGRLYLKVTMSDGEEFHMSYSRILKPSESLETKYDSYLI